MRIFFGVMVCLALSLACTSKKAELYRIQMVGLSTKELLQCAGAPANSFQHGPLTVFTYSLTAPRMVLVTPHIAGPSEDARQICEASVLIEQDAVANVTYRTPYGSETCEPIFRACPAWNG